MKNRFLTLAKKHQTAVVVLLVESLGVAITTLLFALGLILDANRNPKHFALIAGADISLVAIFGATTAMAIFITRQLAMRKRWARSAAVFWQLIQIAIAWNSFSGDLLGVLFGLWLAGSAVVGLYFLFTKDVIEGTTEKIDRE